MNASLQQSFEAARRITRHHARTFYFSSLFLPRHKQNAAYAVYAFCRHADDLLDVHATDAMGPQRGQLNETLDLLYNGKCKDLEFAGAFHYTITEHSIPRKYFDELVEGVCMDRGRIRIATWEELDRYCYLVASVVGLIMSRIFGLRDPAGEKQASALGTAMQLTNILRDIREDYERDRLYLPAEEVTRFGVSEEDIRLHRVTPQFIKLMKFQVARAREHYAESEKGIPMLANDGSQFTVWAMRWIYAGILDEIEQAGHDVYARRASVSFPRKLRLAIRAWRSLPHSKIRNCSMIGI